MLKGKGFAERHEGKLLGSKMMRKIIFNAFIRHTNKQEAR